MIFGPLRETPSERSETLQDRAKFPSNFLDLLKFRCFRTVVRFKKGGFMYQMRYQFSKVVFYLRSFKEIRAFFKIRPDFLQVFPTFLVCDDVFEIGGEWFQISGEV